MDHNVTDVREADFATARSELWSGARRRGGAIFKFAFEFSQIRFLGYNVLFKLTTRKLDNIAPPTDENGGYRSQFAIEAFYISLSI